MRWWRLLSNLCDTEELDSVYADTYDGRSWGYFKAELHNARDRAIHQMAKAAEELGANAVIGVKIDYKTPVGFSGYYEREGNGGGFSMYAESVWVIATGTAVRL